MFAIVCWAPDSYVNLRTESELQKVLREFAVMTMILFGSLFGLSSLSVIEWLEKGGTSFFGTTSSSFLTTRDWLFLLSEEEAISAGMSRETSSSLDNMHRFPQRQ